ISQSNLNMKSPFISVVTLLLAGTMLHCTRGQKQAFDLTKLIPSRGSEPIWTTISRNLPQVQGMIDVAREQCIKQLNMPKDQRPLIKATDPSDKEKCMLECLLKKIKMMDDTNKLSLAQVAKLTSLVTQDNKVAIAISSSMAQSCNRSISASNSCEAAHLFNQCIGRQLERSNVKLTW
ncbi:hypothetical protein KR009_007897, partial [Drosophila setifemur]